jgi:hypothetical protein
MHHEIARVPFVLGRRSEGPTRGITGLVYRSIRGTTRALGLAYDVAVAQLGARSAERPPTRRGEAVRAALNGVVGDHLAATGNPLAIPMRLRHEGRALLLDPASASSAVPGARPRVVVLVHGSCLDDRSWARDGDEHGAALASELDCTAVYLHYNSGLHVSTNGRSLAALLEELVRTWPVPLEGLSIVGHSMGGLLARSACHYATEAGLEWPRLLDALIFVGTPHHGAPLAVGGHFAHAVLGVSPYTAPIALLGRICSAGVTDLRRGSLLDEDWEGRDQFAPAPELPTTVPLPAKVRCFAIAGSTARLGAVLGDGLVPVNSALGRQRDPRRALAFPEARQWVAWGVGHMDLLGDAAYVPGSGNGSRLARTRSASFPRPMSLPGAGSPSLTRRSPGPRGGAPRARYLPT